MGITHLTTAALLADALLELRSTRCGAPRSIAPRRTSHSVSRHDCVRYSSDYNLAYLRNRFRNPLAEWRPSRTGMQTSILKRTKFETTPGTLIPTRCAIGNEDFWEEMVPVDVGHWATADLRKLTEEVGLKAEYDRYYGWTSGFVHGQWGPIRESVFRTCLNPLHRGHRCPYENDPEQLPPVTIDMEHCLNSIFSDVDRAYPSFGARFSTNPNT